MKQGVTEPETLATSWVDNPLGAIQKFILRQADDRSCALYCRKDEKLFHEVDIVVEGTMQNHYMQTVQRLFTEICQHLTPNCNMSTTMAPRGIHYLVAWLATSKEIIRKKECRQTAANRQQAIRSKRWKWRNNLPELQKQDAFLRLVAQEVSARYRNILPRDVDPSALQLQPHCWVTDRLAPPRCVLPSEMDCVAAGVAVLGVAAVIVPASSLMRCWPPPLLSRALPKPLPLQACPQETQCMNYVKYMHCEAYIERMIASGYQTMDDLRHRCTATMCKDEFGMPPEVARRFADGINR